MRLAELVCRALAGVLVLCPLPARPATWLVRQDGSGDFVTIAAALAAAVPADSVIVGSGAYTEHGLVMKAGVSLLSEAGQPALATVDAEGADRCLNVVLVPGSTYSVIRGLTFRNGSADFGGAIRDTLRARVYDCVFLDNTATSGDGGALYRPRGVYDSRFENNSAPAGAGGAVYMPGYVRGSRFESNDALNAGALAGHFVTVFQCSFVENTATQRAGALSMGGSSDYEDTRSIYGCLFARNRAGTVGGALTGTDIVEVVSCTFAANEASAQSAIWWTAANPLVSLVLAKSILAFGTGTGPAEMGARWIQCIDSFGNSDGDVVDGIGDQIHVDPLFCGLFSGDYSLRSDSPCLTYCDGIGFDLVPGCGSVQVEDRSWSRIKSAYRE